MVGTGRERSERERSELKLLVTPAELVLWQAKEADYAVLVGQLEGVSLAVQLTLLLRKLNSENRGIGGLTVFPPSPYPGLNVLVEEAMLLGGALGTGKEKGVSLASISQS